jgi:hypothetical protein
VAVLDDVEDLAVGTVLGVAGSVKSTILRFISVAVSPFASPSLPWHMAQIEGPPLLGARDGLGRRLDGIRLFGCFHGNCSVDGCFCGVEAEDCCAECTDAKRTRMRRE